MLKENRHFALPLACICGFALLFPLREKNLRPCLARTLLLFLIASAPSLAQRLPVLRQIDLPNSTYYREMYLPQWTSGPSSVAWMPDSKSITFSMQGCLWRQSLDGITAEQLTDGPGYDYQPDVSADGRWVIYAKYDHDAIELWLLDLSTRQSKQLTKTGAANVEPRWSPAFKSGDMRVAFVSTQVNRHFHIFVAQFDPAKGELTQIQRLTEERRGALPRVAFSIYDHEISPTWSPDGKEIIFVSNHNHADGVGGFWRMNSQPLLVEAPPPVPRGPFGMMARRLPPIVKEESRQIYDQDITWRARPDWSVQSGQIVYAAYLGSTAGGPVRLHRMSSEGKDSASLSQPVGNEDNINPRWSPDGKSIAFVSNRGGFSLWIQDVASERQRQLPQKKRKFLGPVSTIRLQGGDPSGVATPVRISVTAADGRAYAPDSAWVYSDEGFDRTQRPFEAHYFYLNVSTLRPSEPVTVPAGKVRVEITRGLERLPVRLDSELEPGENKIISFRVQPLRFSNHAAGVLWRSGDADMHTIDGGAYPPNSRVLVTQMTAEDVAVGSDFMTNIGERTLGPADRAANIAAARRLMLKREFRSSYWGDLVLLGPHIPPRLHAAYADPPLNRVYPANATIAELAKGEELAGYAHLFSQPPDPTSDAKLTHELPVDVALGKVDYYELLDSGDAKSSAAVWYKLLNLGFRIPLAAGSGVVTGYASTRGPVGLDRVYVRVPGGPFKMDSWFDGLKRGRSFVTNGPLLRFTLAGQTIGGELKIPARQSARFTASMRSIVPVDHLEVVCNGEVAINVPMNKTHDSSDASGRLYLGRSGWCVLRAWSEKPEDPILEGYPYATTSPIYVTVADAKPSAPEDGKYFLDWIDRVTANTQSNPGFKTEAQKSEVLKLLEGARAIYEKLAIPSKRF